MPVITLEVLSDSSNGDHFEQSLENIIEDQQVGNNAQNNSSGVHFLTEKIEELHQHTANDKDQDVKEMPKNSRSDLLEYMIRSDGSVICKLCGEILQSRTHWYRHKYKLHVVQPLNPAPLFQCEQCLVYFKSRKGYIGHLASRHSDVLSDSSPVLTNSQALEASLREQVMQQAVQEIKEESDPELAIPKTMVPNYQTNNIKQTTKQADVKRTLEPTTSSDWDEKRTREEKLVADIIDRVRRECEAQGSGGAARRGYTRRTTVMNM
ncbi:hypothetical protein ACJJTC_007831 [Scirpophaga incertulas]